MEILLGIYAVIGTLAARSLFFSNTTVVGFGVEGLINGHFQIWLYSFFLGFLLGWILIPIWIIRGIIKSR